MVTINDVKVKQERLNNGQIHLSTTVYHCGLIHHFDAEDDDMLRALYKLEESLENNGFDVQFFNLTR